MPRFAANIDLMFTEEPFLQRFAAAAAYGFRAVEILNPHVHDGDAMVAAARAADVQVLLINTPIPDMPGADKGAGVVPGAKQRFAREAEQSVAIASKLGAGRIHTMAGLADPDDPIAADCFVDNVRLMADLAAAKGITSMLEPLNNRDFPGYFLNHTDQAMDLMARIDRPNVQLQYDFFHNQVMGGDVCRRFLELLPRIGHVQIANAPARHEPGVGEQNYDYIFGVIDDSDYDGWTSLEYRPSTTTDESLRWAEKYGHARS